MTSSLLADPITQYARHLPPLLVFILSLGLSHVPHHFFLSTLGHQLGWLNTLLSLYSSTSPFLPLLCPVLVGPVSPVSPLRPLPTTPGLPGPGTSHPADPCCDLLTLVPLLPLLPTPGPFKHRPSRPILPIPPPSSSLALSLLLHRALTLVGTFYWDPPRF